MPAFTAVLELSSLNGKNGFQINGELASDLSGASVASAGDVNGDGIADLIVAASGASPNGFASGASYVVFGKTSGFAANLNLSKLNGKNGFQINGEAANDYSASSAASAGDINGDGFDDLIIGAESASPNGSASGASYVVFGKASGFGANCNLSTLDGVNGFQINGEAAGDHAGASVSSAGDVNGDGFDDLVIGAPSADPNGSNSGASYVVFGKASGFAAGLDLSALDGTNGFQINGEAAFDFGGSSVASAGDVNGDGFDDIILGAFGTDLNGTNSGTAYVIFGTETGFSANLDPSTLDGSTGFQISGEAAFDALGGSVASAGDVNGDGFDDLIVGGAGADPNGEGSGASYVVFGNASGFSANIDLALLDGTNGFQISGKVADDESGGSVAAAGDVNKDGFDDLIVGAESADSGGKSFSGASYIIFGHANGTINRTGTDGADILSGGEFDDEFIGLGGNDFIRSGAGADTVFGGEGEDRIAGGRGKDTLDGGGDADTFVFLSKSEGGDEITNFVSNDFFEFKASAFDHFAKGALQAKNFVSRADNHAQDANDHFIFRTTDDTLWFDSNGSKSGGLTEIADLSNDFALKAHDILIG